MAKYQPKPANFVSSSQFKLIAEKEAKFILEHAEKQLKETNDTAVQIVTRSTTFLTVNVGFIVALSGFCITRWASNSQRWDTQLFIAFWLIVYLIAIIVTVALNLLPRSYQMQGADPADFFLSDEVFVKENEPYRMTAIYINEILEIQKKLDHNKAQNEWRWKLFNLTVFLLALTPIVVAVLYFVSTFLFGS